ncbi:MAG: hypothetical protein M1840_002556 [Geoglossum simile]|nr:MAG: hypothetical protein M1840_002556 [Geoglossum simile]
MSVLCLRLVCLLGCAGLVSAGADDFSSNLFSDIAPLIALFGEQVAKQYLSQRLGFLENIIFACAPLGILTAVTCAIRVGGPVALRALIGRAQEPAVQVELDLLGSTSSDVCELWDGKQVVRLAGSADILELVYDEDGCVYDRDDAMELRSHGSTFPWLPSLVRLGKQSPDVELSELHQLVGHSDAAPNILLNGGSIHPFEIRLVALIALTLQIGVLVFDGFSVYNMDLSKAISRAGTPADGLPLTVAGTLAVVIGVFICSYVIDARTRLARWVPKDKAQSLRVLWLQKTQVLGDRRFQSCAIFADKSRHEIVKSRYDHKRKLAPWACLAACVTAVGFICQLIGFRRMHYQAAVAQFVATIIMIILRAMIRRYYTRRPVLDYDPGEPLGAFGIVELAEGHELNEIAKRLTKCKEWVVCSGRLWGHDNTTEEPSSKSTARKALQNRQRLRELCGGFKSLQTSADSVGDAMDAIMNCIWATRVQAQENDSQLHWSIEVATTGKTRSLTTLDIPLSRSGGQWRVDRAVIEAILGMWLSQLRDYNLADSGDNLWLLSFADDKSCEISQLLLDFLNPGGARLELVTDVVETCEQRRIDRRRVLHYSTPGVPLDRRAKRALLSQSDLDSMCAQYLIMVFLCQVTAHVHESTSAPSLEADPKSHIMRIQDPLFESIRSSIESTGFVAREDSYVMTFYALNQAGKLPDPLSLLPEIVSTAALQEKGEASKTCSRIRQLFEWKAGLLANEGPPVKVAELGLRVIGAFCGAFGYDSSETVKARELAQEIVLATELGNAGLGDHVVQVPTSGPSLQESTPTDVVPNTNQTPGAGIQGGELEQSAAAGGGQTQGMASSEAPGEDAFLDAVKAGDVQKVRRGLLFSNKSLSEIMPDGMVAAYYRARDDCTFERTEIIRLFVLGGTLLNDRYTINADNLMGIAAKAGNIALARDLLERAKRNGFQVDVSNALCTAVEFGYEHFVRLLLESGGDANMKGGVRGIAVLNIAALYGHEAIARYLVSQGARLQNFDPDRISALGLAARGNHDSLGLFLIEQELKESSRFISDGVGFRYKAYGGNMTSMNHVAAQGNINLVQVLLDKGWDINGAGGSSLTPLVTAIRRGHEHVANLLIEKGGRLDTYLLHEAAGKGLTGTTKLLISKGADVNAVHNKGTPLSEAAAEGHGDVAKLLIDNGALLDVKHPRGEPLLLGVSDGGHQAVSKLLLEAGAPLTDRRKDESTIVHSAARHGHLEVISILVAKGVELDVTDKDLRSPLHFAAQGGHSEVVEALLKAKPGGWVNEKCGSRCSPLRYAVSSGRVEAARILVQNGASMTGRPARSSETHFELAVDQANVGIVGVFMEMGAAADLGSQRLREIGERLIESSYIRAAERIDTLKALVTKEPAYQTDGNTSLATQLLLYAARRNRPEAAKLLVDLGADVSDGEAIQAAFDCDSRDAAKVIFPHTPMLPRTAAARMLFGAAANGDADSVRFWLTHRVPADAADARGKTALYRAAAKGHIDVLAALLEVNSTPEFVNARSNSGATALYAGAKGASPSERNSNLDIVRMLVEHGADPALMKKGSTPLDVARALEVRWIVKFLEEVSGRGT